MGPTKPSAGDATRRCFLRVAAAGGVTAGVLACAPAAAPNAPAAPAGGAAVPAGAKPAWEKEWDDLVVAAKKEGSLRLLTQIGAGYRKAADRFEQAFPGITVQLEGSGTAALIMPRILQERRAKIYEWDAASFSVRSFLTNLRPEGVFDPVRPLLFRPDVLDDKAWVGGFDSGFVDSAKQLVYVARWYTGESFWIDTAKVPEGEIKSVKDLLDPKWKGRMTFADVRSGSTVPPMFAVRTNLGDEVVKRLMVDQQPNFSRDDRLLVEGMVRGTYPIGLGIRRPLLQEYLSQGQGRTLKPLDLPEARVVLSSSGLWMFNQAPHPNAAKLFANWILTKEGQSAWNESGAENSRRVDVPPVDADSVPTAEKKAVYTASEEMLEKLEETRKLLEDLVKR